MHAENTIALRIQHGQQNNYHIAGYFRGGKFSRVSRIESNSGNFCPQNAYFFNRYSLQFMTIRESFPLEKLEIAQFVKIFLLENNLLYGMYMYVVKAKQTKVAFTWLMYFMVIKLAVLDQCII